MINLSNILSLLRAPLAFVLLVDSPSVRLAAIFIAMVTDWLDGFLARLNRNTSQLGAVLDPLMDKFFVVFALGVFFTQDCLSGKEMAALLCRDIAVLIFGCYLLISGRLRRIQFQSIWAGKIATTLQFFYLMALTCQIAIPESFTILFVVLGLVALLELCLTHAYLQSRV